MPEARELKVELKNKLAEKQYNNAMKTYNESIILSKNNGNHSIAATALTNAAMASIRGGEYEETTSLLDEALDLIRSLEDSYSRWISRPCGQWR